MAHHALGFETEETRELRERHNAIHSMGVVVQEEAKEFISMPCPAGVVLVDLSDMAENEGGLGGVGGGGGASFSDKPKRKSVYGLVPPGLERQPTYSGSAMAAVAAAEVRAARRSGRSSTRDFLPIPSGFGGGSSSSSSSSYLPAFMRMRSGRSRSPGDGRLATRSDASRGLFGRRKRRGSNASSTGGDMEPGSQTALNGEALSGETDALQNEEKVAAELLHFQLPPKRGAEEAKSMATRSAQIREEYVAQEMKVRQIWRVHMGNAPGLKAEIAKLHATETAKFALREYEMEQRQRRSWDEPPSTLSPTSHARPASPPSPSVSPNSGGGGLLGGLLSAASLGGGGGHAVGERPPIGEPPGIFGSSRSDPSPSVHGGATAAGGGASTAPRRRAGSGDQAASGNPIFGWMIGKKGRSSPTAEVEARGGATGQQRLIA